MEEPADREERERRGAGGEDQQRDPQTAPFSGHVRPHGSGSPHGLGPVESRPAPSKRAARVHGEISAPAGAGAGAVSRRKPSIAAAIAAASSGLALAAVAASSIRGRAGRCLPFRGLTAPQGIVAPP